MLMCKSNTVFTPALFFFFFKGIPLFFFNYLFIYLFIYLFLAVLGLHFCARAFSSCGEWGPLFIAVRGPLTLVASIVAQHRLQTRRLSSCGSRAQLLRGMWDLPRPGLEPASPALAGRLSTTAPPGKPCPLFMMPFSSGSLVWISCFRLKKGHELSSLAGNPNHMVS